MNRLLSRALLIGAAATALFLSGCATPYYSAADVAYVPAYYDGYYGPYWDGYWGPDGFFYFYDVQVHHFRRDDGSHFRHAAAPGFHGIARAYPPRGIQGPPSHAFIGGGRGADIREHRG